MTPHRIASLVGAAIITVLAAIATIDHWTGAAPALRTTALGAWIVFAIATSHDRTMDAIANLRADIETYGDQRNSDGIIDGMNHSASQVNPPKPLRRIH